ncbi:MAG: hypothetical protein QM619_01020 [Micropruina sp.]|uniref:hypothetical protein n=1 Tax=Micropruina sp. TaxID=2737536 RepID=UPI0039E524A3
MQDLLRSGPGSPRSLWQANRRRVLDALLGRALVRAGKERQGAGRGANHFAYIWISEGLETVVSTPALLRLLEARLGPVSDFDEVR